MDASTAAPARFVAARKGRHVYLIRTEDISLLRADGKYVRLHTTGGEYLVRQTLAHLESRLDSARFLRISRSTIVGLDYVRYAESSVRGRYLITMRDGIQAHSTASYRARIDEVLHGP